MTKHNMVFLLYTEGKNATILRIVKFVETTILNSNTKTEEDWNLETKITDKNRDKNTHKQRETH